MSWRVGETFASPLTLSALHVKTSALVGLTPLKKKRSNSLIPELPTSLWCYVGNRCSHASSSLLILTKDTGLSQRRWNFLHTLQYITLHCHKFHLKRLYFSDTSYSRTLLFSWIPVWLDVWGILFMNIYRYLSYQRIFRRSITLSIH